MSETASFRVANGALESFFESNQFSSDLATLNMKVCTVKSKVAGVEKAR